MDDLSRFCCLNSRCPDFGRRDAGNLTVTGRLGKSRQFRLLSCRTCRDRFSERTGTPLYRAHLLEDRFRGDCWDHVAFDPEHRLVVSVVPGERTTESVQELVGAVKERLDGRVPDLITTDESSAYEGAILEAFGTEVVPPRTGKPWR